MSERAAMKRRVRGLLHRKWLGPLAAIVLAALPMAAFAILAFFLTRSFDGEAPSLFAQAIAFFDNDLGFLATMIILPETFKPDFTHILAITPVLSMVVGAALFIGFPITVSFSGYYNGFLRGRQPKPWSVFSCFSGSYPRALTGMLYLSLWVFLWLMMAVVGPVLLYLAGKAILTILAEQLSMSQLYPYAVLFILCILWFVVFSVVFINRLLAYCLTPVCIAAQPRLPAHRAVRLSRKLMRGNKWNLIGLILSCLIYLLPAVVFVILLVLLPQVAGALILSSIVQYYIRIGLYALIGLNALLVFYVAPYTAACFHAFYIERKREALMDAEVTSDDFTAGPKREKTKRGKKKSDESASTDRRRHRSSAPSSEPYGASEINLPAVSEPEPEADKKQSEAQS